MPTKKIAAAVCFAGVLALIAIPFSISCIGDEAEPTVLESQDAVEVPAFVESGKLCNGCLQEPLKKLAQRPAVKKVSDVARKFRAKRKPVRSLLRRLFSR